MTKTNYCSNCGEKINKNDIYCSNCGEKINDSKNKLKIGRSAKIYFIATAIISSIAVLIGNEIFNELYRNSFGYYGVNTISDIIGVIIFLFLIVITLTPLISVFNIKTNLILYSRDNMKIGEFLEKFKNNIFKDMIKFMLSFFIYFFIVLVSLIISFGLVYMVFHNYDKFLENRNIFIFLSSFLGIYLSGRFIFFGYYNFDKNYGPIKALKNSYNLTKKITFKIFFYQFIFLYINYLGIATKVGAAISIPFTFYVLTNIYHNSDYKFSNYLPSFGSDNKTININK